MRPRRGRLGKGFVNREPAAVWRLASRVDSRIYPGPALRDLKPRQLLRQMWTEPAPSWHRFLRRLQREAVCRLLPVVELPVSESPAETLIVAAPSPARALHLRGAYLLYLVPADGRPFRGRSAHGRRNSINRARKAGLVTRTEVLRRGQAQYAPAAPMSFCELPQCSSRYYLAFGEDGSLLAVTHTHTDNTVAYLHFAVHARGRPATGPARFALFEHTVRDLASRGVRHFLIPEDLFTTPVGVREFARILGFIPTRVRLFRRRDQGAGGPAVR